MGPIAVRRVVRRRPSGGLLGVVAVLAVAGAVAVHHLEPAAMDGGHDMAAAHVMQPCLGAMVAVGAAVAAVALGLIALGRSKPVRCVGNPGRPDLCDVPSPVPRAGPLLLCLLCLSRR